MLKKLQLHFSFVYNLERTAEIGNSFPAAIICPVTPLRKRHVVSKFLRTALFSTFVIAFGRSIARHLNKQKLGFRRRSEIRPAFDWSELCILTRLVQLHHPPRKVGFVWQSWDAWSSCFRESGINFTSLSSSFQTCKNAINAFSGIVSPGRRLTRM
jgi:hypothetical protein